MGVVSIGLARLGEVLLTLKLGSSSMTIEYGVFEKRLANVIT